MARLPRLYAPGIPQLVHARFLFPLALRARAGSRILDTLQKWLFDGLARHGVMLHAWTLTDDGILLLATPDDEKSLSRLIQMLGRNLATTLRSGPVFSGRYRSTLVEPGVWVIPSMIWLESWVAREKGASDSELWPWSSAGFHTGAFMGSCPVLNDHADYWSSGNTPFDRQAAYKYRYTEGLSSGQLQQIAQALHGQWALGSPGFINQLCSVASRRPMQGRRGRPRIRSVQNQGQPLEE
ncbi:MAG: hypothetical protein ACTIKR_02495 [Advenella sp.]|uniref:Transposase n=1 Tax=Advenella kashmirensis TaxID=310575 RepID=A0A356LJG0_9BURK|nr:hypothetical protein [Advenella sp. FME57]HBP30701.1 hypothetical protein [Advenella kashmirensis]